MRLYKKSGVSDECYAGEFSAVCTEGVYRLKVGNELSRIFYIDDRVYESLSRMITQFFVWQRCGDKKGWNGLCHMNDSLVDKHGKLHQLNGGHHQSGDLRKWAFGVPRGIFGLSEYLMLNAPLWNDGEIEYDIAHSVKYFLNRQSDEGYIFDCSFVPVDYNDAECHGRGCGDYNSFHKAFRYYDRPCDPHGEWATLCMFASAAKSLEGYDRDLAERAKHGAEKLWDYMQREGRYISDFDWVDYPPIGHDTFKSIFDLYYSDSFCNLVNEIYAGIALYKVGGDRKVKERIIKSLSLLAELSVKDSDGAMLYFKQSKENGTPNKIFSANAPLAFVMALEIFPDEKDSVIWKDVCKSAIKRYEREAAENAYGIVSNSPDGYYEYMLVTDCAETAAFLSKASRIFGREKTLPTAQRLIDFVIGFNPGDISAVEGVGYNQAQHAVFGEFFPSQPQLPGGVFTDFQPHKNSFDNYGVEYDMPIAGEYLYAVNCFLNALL